MEDDKNLKNQPAVDEEVVSEETKAEEVKEETKEQQAMSSEALKVSVYASKKNDDFDDEEFMKPLSYWERKKRERKANKEVKAKHVRRKLNKMEKTLLALLGVVLVCVVIYFIYYFVHYVNYNHYKDFLSDYEYVEGTTYKPLSDSECNVEGFDLVAESQYLKLYTDTKTGNVAVYDKRNGETVYTNPLNADNDTVANPTNISMLKSQFILYYYNDDKVSGTYTSYSDSVAKGAFKVEGIDNGIRYIYTVGDSAIGFTIPLEYRLCDDYLEVSIPEKGIEELGAGYVYRIQLLRYMAATSYDDEGYMVVPNGSGSLINFNNGKLGAATYSQYIYDIDPLAANYTTVETVESARLPLYGICKPDSSVLVTVEDSAANCVITAGISGAFNDYNYAYPTFVLRITDNLRMFGDSTTDVYVMEPNAYDSNMVVRYTFLTEENSGYTGIANYYRDRLINEGVLTERTESGDIPFYYDVITGVKETGHFLGVQYLHTFSMTTFNQAGEMSDAFAEAGITNQVMNLQGWFNRGYYHDAANNIDVMGKLGGTSDLEALNSKLSENGGTLYGDVAFQQVSAADRWFPYSKEASRYYGAGYVATFGLINPTTLRNTSSLGYVENKYYLLSPKFLPRYVEGFVADLDKLELDGISLRDLGCVLSSDKKRTCMVTREEALDIVIAQYQLLEGTGRSIMTNQANAYSFAYTDHILNAPIEDTDYDIIDEQIPLYEMIVHGYINYSSDQMNFDNADEIDKKVLLLIETGASPRYVFTAEESSRMKLTALNRFYTTTFDVWKDDAIEAYNRVNEALSQVSGCAMVDHQIIDEYVRKVTYDNGVVIYINYGRSEADVDGVAVGAMSYTVEEGR